MCDLGGVGAEGRDRVPNGLLLCSPLRGAEIKCVLGEMGVFKINISAGETIMGWV